MPNHPNLQCKGDWIEAETTFQAWGEDKWVDKILELMETVDDYIPTPERDTDKPFLLAVEDVFSISGRGTVCTGRVEQGIVKKGDEVEILGRGKKPQKSVITGIRMFNTDLQKAQLATRSACCAVVSRRMQCSVVRWFAHQVPRQLTPSSRPTFTLQRRTRVAETTQWCLDTCLSSTSAPAMWPAKLRAWPALKEVRCRWPCQEMTSPANASSLPPPPLRRACASPCVRTGWLVVTVIAQTLIIFVSNDNIHMIRKTDCHQNVWLALSNGKKQPLLLRVVRPSARVLSRRPCRQGFTDDPFLHVAHCCPPLLFRTVEWCWKEIRKPHKTTEAP